MNPHRPRMHRAHPAPGDCPGTGRHPWPMLAIALLAVGLFATSEPTRADGQTPDPVTAATADSPLELPVSGLIERVKYRALVRPDPDGELDPQDLLASDTGFVPFDPALDRHASGTWLKFHAHARPESSGRFVLRVDRRFFPQLDVFLPRIDNSHEEINAGIGSHHDAQRVGRELVFRAEIPSGESGQILVYIKTLQNSLRPLRMVLQDENTFSSNQAVIYLAYGLYFGVLLALIFHNFILYLNLRQRGHLLYVLAMLSITAMMALDSGLIESHVLSAESQTIGFRMNILFVILTYCFIGRFFQVFVHSEQFVPGLHKLVTISVITLAAMAAILILIPVRFALPSLMVAQPILVLVLIILLVSSFLAGVRGSTEGKIFFIAWSCVFIGSFIRLFLSFDLIESNTFLEHTLYVGSVLEASILALGLSYRVRQLHERHSVALREQHKAARLANLDPLTNAYNRRFLENYLGNLLRDKHKRPFAGAVLILDLDDFKTANDEHGHAAGDAILRDLVQRCQQVMRDSDVLCRLGGDEFVIVLSDLAERKAVEVASRVARAIGDEPFIFENQQIPVTTSIGVVADIPEGSTVTHCLRMADQALYRAKQAGRNRVVVHDPEDTTPFRHGPSIPREGQESA